mmetsp:Transcript_499/g.995  ORF Transcript_499/g.995 Transcript_499/m.995 type:complete len:201 (-) Transcript_499:2-604(-)
MFLLKGLGDEDLTVSLHQRQHCFQRTWRIWHHCQGTREIDCIKAQVLWNSTLWLLFVTCLVAQLRQTFIVDGAFQHTAVELSRPISLSAIRCWAPKVCLFQNCLGFSDIGSLVVDSNHRQVSIQEFGLVLDQSCGSSDTDVKNSISPLQALKDHLIPPGRHPNNHCVVDIGRKKSKNHQQECWYHQQEPKHCCNVKSGWI